MTDKDEFSFGEHAEPTEEEPRRNQGASAEGKKSSTRRLFLLLILLLVAAGAALFFFLGSQEAPPPPAPPERQPIALPVPPPPPAEQPAATAAKPQAPVSEPAAAPAAPAKKEAAAAKEEKVAAMPAPPAAPESKVAGAVPARGGYFLQAGAYLLKENLRGAEATVRRLGFEPRVKTVVRTLPMTRLRVGAFFAEEGEAKLKALKAVAPDAFLIRQGEYVLVYAGTYQDLDRARRAADLLYQKGIRVDEEAVKAEASLSLLSFGDFADPAAAREAAARARKAGLDVIVRKDP